MSGGWRVTAASSDSEDEVILTGPVTQRELEISRLLNETICLTDSSGDVSGCLAELEQGMRGLQVAGPCSSATLPEVALHPAAGDASFRLSANRACEENPPEYPPAAQDTTSDSRQWQEMPSECPLAAPDNTSDSRQWQEMPSESFHTCSGGGSRRTTGLSERFFSPSARLDSTGGTDSRPADVAMMESEEDNAAVEGGSAYGFTVVPPKDSTTTEVDTDMYAVETGDGERCDASPDALPVRPRTIGSCVSDDEPVFVDQAEYSGAPPAAAPGRGSYVYSVAGDSAKADPAAARTSTISLTESESRYSSGGDSQSEFNNTLEIIERLLELEAEERRMETILRERTAGEGSAALEQLVDEALMTDDEAAAEGEASASAADGVEEQPARPVPTARHGVPAPAPEAKPRRGLVPSDQKTRGTTAKSPVRTNGAPRGRGATPRGGGATPRGGGATPRGGSGTPRGGSATPASAAKSARGGNLPCGPARAACRTATPLKTPVRPSPLRKLATPLRSTPGHKTQMLVPPSLIPRNAPLNLADVTSPVARYIQDAPPPLVQNLLPRDRPLNAMVPQPRPPAKLQAVAEEEDSVLRDANAAADCSACSRIPVKVPLAGPENQRPALPEVSYKSSGNLVMDRSSWNKLVKKSTAMNKKLGRFLASPKPVLAVKHAGHKSVASRRVKWHDEFSVPDTAVRVRPMRRSISDPDITLGTDGSLMEVSVCEVRSARPALRRPAPAGRI